MDIKKVLKEKYQEDQVILDILEDDLIIKKLNEISEIINRKIKNFNTKITKEDIINYFKFEEEYYLFDEIRSIVADFCLNNQPLLEDMKDYGIGFVIDFIVIHKKEKADLFRKRGLDENEDPFDESKVLFENDYFILYNYY